MTAEKAHGLWPGGARHARGLRALPRAASPPLPCRHPLRASWRPLRGQRPPTLTVPVPADAAGPSFGLVGAVNALRRGGSGRLPVRARAEGRLRSGGKPRGRLGKCWQCQWCFNAAPLTAPADRRSATPRTRRMAGRGQAAAIRPPNPRRTSAAPCPRYTPRPRALAAAEGHLKGARAQLVHADHDLKGAPPSSRSISPGPAQRGACTYERWNGAGHRPG